MVQPANCNPTTWVSESSRNRTHAYIVVQQLDLTRQASGTATHRLLIKKATVQCRLLLQVTDSAGRASAGRMRTLLIASTRLQLEHMWAIASSMVPRALLLTRRHSSSGVWGATQSSREARL
jgi:hypothetical protein